MPVIPKCIPPYTIHPPKTLYDDGKPSPSLRKDCERIFEFIQDERHLTAEILLTSVRQRIDEYERENSNNNNKEQDINIKKQNSRRNLFANKHKREAAIAEQDAKERRVKEIEDVKILLEKKKNVINKLENRCRIFRRAQQNLNQDDDWIYASKHFGIKTYYRHEIDNSLSIKLEGDVTDINMFEQICCLKEVDLHYKWSPFCTSSITIADLDKLDVIGWFMIGMPHFGLSRDGCFRAIGCDNITEDNSVLLAGQGVHDIMPGKPQHEETFLSNDPILDQLEIPPVPTRRGSGRMTIRKFEAVMKITSPTSATTKVVANIDPNISFLPNSLLEFIMKHLAGVVLSKMQGAAKKAAKNPVTNVHAKKMRQEKEFYQDWLMPKFKGICEEKGWEMPKVAAFEISPAEIQHEGNRVHFSRSKTFNDDTSIHHHRPEQSRRGKSADDVVENLSQISEPAIRRKAHSVDGMSELSSDSSKKTTWTTNNPIVNYFREVELKAQRQKEEEIASIRRKMNESLQPKELSASNLERLSELKQAKARRLKTFNNNNETSSTTSQTVEGTTTGSGRRDSFSLRFSQQLQSYSPSNRFLVVLSLIVILFVMTHPLQLSRLFHINIGIESSDVAWRTIIIQDIGALFYIVLCAVPHFLLCDIALVYTFESLELGAKTGRQVKKFYSDTVRFGVAIGSLSIVSASILKAAAKVWLRFFFWSVAQIYTFMDKHILSRGKDVVVMLSEYIPNEVYSVFGYTASVTRTIETFFIWAIQLPFKFFYHFLITTNFVGRGIERLFRTGLSVCNGFVTRSNDFIMESIESFEGKSSMITWRTDALDTASSLFSYTSVFLLTTLVLFIFSAKGGRDKGNDNNRPLDGDSNRIANMVSTVSSMSVETGGSSDHDAPVQVSTSGSTSKLSIPEDAEVHHNSETVGTMDSFIPNASDSASVTARKRLRFRFRKNKSESTPIEEHTDLTQAKPMSKSKSF